MSRALLRYGPVSIVTNCQHAGMVEAALPGVRFLAVDPRMEPGHARATIRRLIDATGPGVLVVDTFPRGLGGELVSLPWPKVLVHRDLDPRYASALPLDFDLILIPGANEAQLTGALVTAPWVIRSAEELLPLEQARQVLRLPTGQQTCTLVCAAGNPDELPWYGEVTARLTGAVRCVAPVCPPGCPPDAWVRHWPAMELFRAVHCVIGGAGYNTINECAACGIPLIARAWPRKFDRQRLRAERHGIRLAETVDAAVHAAHIRHATSSFQFANGVEDAAAAIAAVRDRHSGARSNTVSR